MGTDSRHFLQCIIILLKGKLEIGIPGKMPCSWDQHYTSILRQKNGFRRSSQETFPRVHKICC